MDDNDVTNHMSLSDLFDSGSHPLILTIPQAAELLGIGRTAAYELANLFEATGGAEGMPCVRIKRLRRVPLPALLAWIDKGCTGGPLGAVADELASRRRRDAAESGGSASAESVGSRPSTRRLTVRRGGEASGGRRRGRGGPPPAQLPLFPAG